jgi:hypothetical protein
METLDFKEGDNVMYIPYHANGEMCHPDCEEGIVSSVTELTVYVKYYKHGRLSSTAQGTNADQLIKR